MKISEKERDFIKLNRTTIKTLLEGRMTDIMNEIVDEDDSDKKVVLSLLVKEFRNALVMMENITNMKESKPGEKFTGM